MSLGNLAVTKAWEREEAGAGVGQLGDGCGHLGKGLGWREIVMINQLKYFLCQNWHMANGQDLPTGLPCHQEV